jgi:hypothetical protein
MKRVARFGVREDCLYVCIQWEKQNLLNSSWRSFIQLSIVDLYLYMNYRYLAKSMLNA